MEITLVELVLLLSASLTCVAVAINARGPVRASVSGVLATAVVGMTVLTLMFGLGPGTFAGIAGGSSDDSEEAPARTRARKAPDTVRVSGRVALPGEEQAPVTEEMKAPQRARQEEAAVQQRKELDSGNPAVAAYQETMRPLVVRARKLGDSIRKFKLTGLESLSDEEYEARKNNAFALRNQAGALAEEILAVKAPREVNAMHPLAVGGAEHLRSAGSKLARFFNAEDQTEEETFRKGARTSAETALRALGEYSRQLQLNL